MALGTNEYMSAFQRLYGASKTIKDSDYPVCHYLLGLAAECALRSVVMKKVESISKPHRIGALYETALKADPRNVLLAQAATNVKFVQLLWDNRDRYADPYGLYIQKFRTHFVIRELSIPNDKINNPTFVQKRVRENMEWSAGGWLDTFGQRIRIG